jgi:hypothetical protein
MKAVIIIPAAQLMKIRCVSFEYIGKDEDIDRFFKAAVRDYIKFGYDAKDDATAFVGSVENLINKGISEKIGSYA